MSLDFQAHLSTLLIATYSILFIIMINQSRFLRHTIDQSADADAARVSLVHGRGGKEYYQKS